MSSAEFTSHWCLMSNEKNKKRSHINVMLSSVPWTVDEVASSAFSSDPNCPRLAITRAPQTTHYANKPLKKNKKFKI